VDGKARYALMGDIDEAQALLEEIKLARDEVKGLKGMLFGMMSSLKQIKATTAEMQELLDVIKDNTQHRKKVPVVRMAK